MSTSSSGQKMNADGSVVQKTFGEKCSALVDTQEKKDFLYKNLASYTVFYLFMAGWMAINLHGLVEELPEYEGTSSRIYRDNGLVMSEPRVKRFMVHALVSANDMSKSAERDRTAHPDPAPWKSDSSPLTGRDLDCTGLAADEKECVGTAQIRLNNAHTLRYIQAGAPITVTCTGLEGNNGTFFSQFTDPHYASRTADGWGEKSASNLGHASKVECLDASSVATGVATGVIGVEGVKCEDQFRLTWAPGATAPHILQFGIGATASTSVDVKCEVDDETYNNGPYHFKDPFDDTFELGIRGIRDVELEYSFAFPN